MTLQKNNKISRRGFVAASTAVAASVALPNYGSAKLTDISKEDKLPNLNETLNEEEIVLADKVLNLTPANWIWYPAKRILPNSFFHFRKSFKANQEIKSARGWIVGDSRYVLFCNGKRIQFGPAPSDPRFTEADPIDLTAFLQIGENIIGATVLYFGFGDGTWPAGKAGFIFKLDIEYEGGTKETVISDTSWMVQLARSWEAGMYKRWYLRALQESFDNRFYPHGWTEMSFETDSTWKAAVFTGGSADKPALNTAISDYLYDSGSPAVSQLRSRQIPLIKEVDIPALNMAEQHWISWKVPSKEYFDILTADAYEFHQGPEAIRNSDNSLTAVLQGQDKGLVMSFELKEQVVGWPHFSIEAPEGTTIELMVLQGHILRENGGPLLGNNNLNSWTRFICRQGRNDFITFDFESVKWIQLHIHGEQGKVTIYRPGVLRRVYDFFAQPFITTSDAALQKLFGASFNTIVNNSQDTIVDCMGRERQQYSGDIGHVVHMLHRAYGESRLPARFVSTFSQGMTLDGFFMDSWPAYDRLNRLAQRQLGLTPWGPLLDHSVGFNYDVWYHYLYSGKKEDVEEVFPRLVKFFNYLRSGWRAGDLLQVENLGVPAVWMDTDSYKLQRHKQCAYNLYVAAMLKEAFSNLCLAFQRQDLQSQAFEMSRELVKAVRKNFWSNSEGMLINNLPWQKEEGELRTCERSLSHYILGGFASEQEKKNLLTELISKPGRLGSCYPPNAQWGYWAMAECGAVQPILNELRTKWISLSAVIQNNTMPEQWKSVPDSNSQYSHASLAPIYVAYMNLAGISVLEPGSAKVKIRLQPGDIEQFSIVNYTPKGPIEIEWVGKKGKKKVSIKAPQGMTLELWLDDREKVKLPLLKKQSGVAVYSLEGGKSWQEELKFT